MGLSQYSSSAATLAYPADALTPHDEAIFGHSIGSAEGQQTWEALVALVALRSWKAHWAELRVCLEVRSDSVSALTVAMRFKSVGHGPRIVARELALEIATGVYRLNVYSHMPGAANAFPDSLSRRY